MVCVISIPLLSRYRLLRTDLCALQSKLLLRVKLLRTALSWATKLFVMLLRRKWAATLRPLWSDLVLRIKLLPANSMTLLILVVIILLLLIGRKMAIKVIRILPITTKLLRLLLASPVLIRSIMLVLHKLFVLLVRVLLLLMSVLRCRGILILLSVLRL